MFRAPQGDQLVCYSSGGDGTRYCQRQTFLARIRSYEAVATRTRRPRSLVLRKGGAR